MDRMPGGENGFKGLSVALAAVVLLPLAALAGPPDPRGPFALLVGVGGGRDGSVATVGAGLAPWDDGTTRVELLARFGFASAEALPLEKGGLTGFEDVSWTAFVGELALARRLGWLEPWVSGGVWTVKPSGEFAVYCGAGGSAPLCATPGFDPRHASVDGTSVTGATFAAGLRFAFSRRWLLEGEYRWRSPGGSRFEPLAITREMGGSSGSVALVMRFGEAERVTTPEVSPAVPPHALAPPPPPSGVVEPPREPPAPPPLQKVFVVHPVRRFQCFPDPVRGGTFCADAGLSEEVTARSACERACRREAEACPASGALGAACARCVEGCAASRPVACTPEQHGRVEGDGCRLDAGSWGNADSVLVPTSGAHAVKEGDAEPPR